MDNNTDPLVIYWAPASYESTTESWSFLYPEPVSLFSQLNLLRNSSSPGPETIYACPAHKDATHNVFVFKNSVENVVDLPKNFLKEVTEEIGKYSHYATNSISFGAKLDSKVYINAVRKSSFSGYVNLTYNMAWLFVSEDPVLAKFTPPYYPHSSPAEGAMLATGEFDIGQWFRPFQLDYHVPLSTTRLTFSEGNPLFYLHVLTDRPVIFKRYIRTSVISNLQEECTQSPARYGVFKSLTEKYAAVKRIKLKEQLMHEIKKNLVE